MSDGGGEAGPTEPGRRNASAGDEPDRPSLQDGVEHLKRAAHESIAAARALLAVAEGLLDDPRTTRTVLDALITLANAANHDKLLEDRRPPDPSGGREDDGGVQRIPVS